ncbi:MAG: class I SAM-dependent methyltransferase [Elusimicrobiales bacterium]
MALETIKQILRRPFRRMLLSRRLRRYAAGIKPGAGYKVVFGGHWAVLPDWLVLSEGEQDITKRLEFPDGSVEVIFTEHVLEHVRFQEGVSFMREAKRILKPGGTLRIVCPVTEKVLGFSPGSDMDREYLKCLERFYPEEKELFGRLGFDGLREFSKVFLLNSIYTGYGHRFIWSSALIAKVLLALGYRDVKVHEIGKGREASYCLERRRRGIYLGRNAAEDQSADYVYDAESLAVEATR